MEEQLRTRLSWILQLIGLCEGDRKLAASSLKSTLYQDGKLAVLYEEREFLRLLQTQGEASRQTAVGLLQEGYTGHQAQEKKMSNG